MNTIIEIHDSRVAEIGVRTRFVAVLEIAPVEPAKTAVRVSIVADGKKGKK